MKRTSTVAPEAMETESSGAEYSLKARESKRDTLDGNFNQGVTIASSLESSKYEVLSERGGFLDPCMLTPPAIAPMKPTTIDVQLLGVEPDTSLRLVVHRQSTVLLERILKTSDLLKGKVTLELPAIPEGLVNFLLIGDDLDSHMMPLSVPCCIVHPTVVQDINNLFFTMSSVARDSCSFPDYATSDQTRFAWVWRMHFCEFLHDVEVLFQWIESTEKQQPSSMIEQVMLQVLQACCVHGAWDFAAYVLTKAVGQGIKICPDPFKGCSEITGESLKAVIGGQ